MASAGLELQAAVYQKLRSDAVLVALLGGPKIYDDVPQQTAFPYITFGHSFMRDWSTASDVGHEHVVTLHVWSRAAGKKKVHEIMSTVEDLLHDRPLPLTGFKLVNFRHEYSDARRDNDGQTYHGTLRYRAVTEAETL
ncbi:MAG: DUF3168 domain-containing protein [Hyphomicrobiaceae bacterium]|nr:DUF3168 domain-containing protein [Hyphomicrobiaceae bacterium]MCC0010268.1 DUF3168 domain-containing protein [Hyphomicrobiaceae bacterium]